MRPVVQIQMQSNLQWAVKRTANRVIAVCEPLNLVLDADTLEELPGIINEGLHLLFIDLLMDNELDAFLRARGWNALGVPNQIPEGDEVQFDVPWNLNVHGNARDTHAQTH